MVWSSPGQYRAGGRVGPESKLNEIRIRVLDEPRRFSGKSSVGGKDKCKVRNVQILNQDREERRHS